MSINEVCKICGFDSRIRIYDQAVIETILVRHHFHILLIEMLFVDFRSSLQEQRAEGANERSEILEEETAKLRSSLQDQRMEIP